MFKLLNVCVNRSKEEVLIVPYYDQSNPKYYNQFTQRKSHTQRKIQTKLFNKHPF